MPSRIPDAYLWLGFGLLTIVAIHSIKKAFAELVPLIKVNEHAYEPKILAQDQQNPEDRISLSDLKTLCKSPNDHIAAAAKSVLIQRYARDEKAQELVREDLISSDPERKAMAKNACILAREGWRDDSHFPFHDFENERAHSFEPFSEDVVGEPIYLTPEQAQRLRERGAVVPSWEDPVAGWARVPHERPELEEVGEDEAERRRRRREAIVVVGGDDLDEVVEMRPR